MPKGMGYGMGYGNKKAGGSSRSSGSVGRGNDGVERKGGGSSKAGQQNSGSSAIGSGHAAGRGDLGTGEKPEAAGSSKTQIKNGVQR
jgi:hypothetical protein